jgi:hypothetical protein
MLNAIHTTCTVILDELQHFTHQSLLTLSSHAGVYNDTSIPMKWQWDISLFKCLCIKSVSDYGYACILEAALWYEQCITLTEAKELTLDSDCLQCIPLYRRQALLDAIALSDMEGKQFSNYSIHYHV